MKATVVNILTHEYDIYIGREGHGHDGYWGNPYSVIRDGGRERVIVSYREYFLKRLRVDPEFARQIIKLKGKRLGCFCKPKACHGDVIAEYLNRKLKAHWANVSDVSRIPFQGEKTRVTVSVPWDEDHGFNFYIYDGDNREKAYILARKAWPTLKGY